MTQQFIRKGVQLETKDVHTLPSRNTALSKVMVVDIETTTTFDQIARVGYYVIKDISSDTIIDTGVFYNVVTDVELDVIEQYRQQFYDHLQAHIQQNRVTHELDLPNVPYNNPFKSVDDYYKVHELKIMTLQQFVKQKLYVCLMNGIAVINHNIPFDLGSIAHSYHGYLNDGFTMSFCNCTDKKPYALKTYRADKEPTIEIIHQCLNHPNIITRRLAGKKANIYVNTDKDNIGAILDTITIGRALLGPGDLSLKAMGKRFKADIRKIDANEGHGNTITHEYLTYMINDVYATLNLFEKQLDVYNQHKLPTSLIHILSEASIGKAYFNLLGIPPFLDMHKNINKEIYDIAMYSYYGARSEVKYRLTPIEIAYADFKSQYPTVNALLGLQELLLAESITVEHVKSKTQTLLDNIKLEHLQDKRIWKQLRILVKIRPNGDILPTRWNEKVEGKGTKKLYAVCKLHSKNYDCWYTMSDLVASKLLTGKTPKIIDAIELIPHGRIETNKIKLFGDDNYEIDLSTDDFFTKVIDLRTSVKDAMKPYSKDSDEYDYYDSLQLALKLLANSTSYGILVETIMMHGDEVAGKFFASPIATHITGAARLLLALAEKLGSDRGISYAACDTDSMMYAKPDTMNSKDFKEHIENIVNWFTVLSPYAKDKDGKSPALFELENDKVTDKETSARLTQLGHNPTNVDNALYFLGVSCKRYGVYNKLPNDQYLLRKISAHATGRYQFDRELPFPSNVLPISDDLIEEVVSEIPSEEVEDDIIDETIPVTSIKWKTYQYIMWYRAIQLAENGINPYVPKEDWSMNLVRYQETITTPSKLKQHAYVSGVRPYSFLTETPTQDVPSTSKRAKKPTTKAKYRYYMSFALTARELASNPVYRTGTCEIEPTPNFEPLYIRFKGFFNNPEMKTANGYDIGILRRRELWLDDIIQQNRSGKKDDNEQKTNKMF